MCLKKLVLNVVFDMAAVVAGGGKTKNRLRMVQVRRVVPHVFIWIPEDSAFKYIACQICCFLHQELKDNLEQTIRMSHVIPAWLVPSLCDLFSLHLNCQKKVIKVYILWTTSTLIFFIKNPLKHGKPLSILLIPWSFAKL